MKSNRILIGGNKLLIVEISYWFKELAIHGSENISSF